MATVIWCSECTVATVIWCSECTVATVVCDCALSTFMFTSDKRVRGNEEMLKLIGASASGYVSASANAQTKPVFLCFADRAS